MSALQRLIIAGVAAALASAPAVAMDRIGRLAADTHVIAQDDCRTVVRCEPADTPEFEFCIAEGTCAVALPASALVRFDALMDAARD